MLPLITNNAVWYLLFLSPTLHTSKHLVKGCSLLPPCGTHAKQLILTDIPGTLHIRVNQYEKCRENTFSNPSEFLSSAIIEVETGGGKTRTEVGKKILKGKTTDIDITSLPTVDQDYQLRFDVESEDVTVLRDNYDPVEFTLTGFKFSGDTSSPYEGVAVFYSKVVNLFYFIYSDSVFIDYIAVCKPGDGKCDISEFNDAGLIARNSDEIVVYDDMQIVGLEVPCCLCRDKIYFLFNESGITKFNILNAINIPNVVDPRIGVAYSIEYENNNILVTSETVRHKQSIRLEKVKLEKLLNLPKPED